VSNYRTHAKIFSQGDPADAVFYIHEGKVKVCVVSDLGKEAVVALHGNGDFFGEGCLNGHSLRVAKCPRSDSPRLPRSRNQGMPRPKHDDALALGQHDAAERPSSRPDHRWHP
jgi:CRP/FNR family cyclic AMP-dependent transcriptional regulator